MQQMEIYTDGSCPDNRNISASNPAGWGYTFRYMHTPEQRYDQYGPVSTFIDDPWHIGAKVGSNNTGELSAVVEALDYLLRFQPPLPVTVSFFLLIHNMQLIQRWESALPLKT